VIDKCCMRKKSGDSLDHILLHCKKASALLNTIFILVELVWVMPVVRETFLLAGEYFGRFRNAIVWKMVLSCIMF
jgi:hypothetical protein